MNHRLLLAAAFLALALSVAACGDGGGDGAAPTETAATPTAGATTAGDTVIISQGTGLGAILTDPDGNTLYAFDNDGVGVSNCDAACAGTWPPLTIAEGRPTGGEGVPSGSLDTIERTDGSLQVTYNGHPLYRYSGDAAPGDANGDGLERLWGVIHMGD